MEMMCSPHPPIPHGIEQQAKVARRLAAGSSSILSAVPSIFVAAPQAVLSYRNLHILSPCPHIASMRPWAHSPVSACSSMASLQPQAVQRSEAAPSSGVRSLMILSRSSPLSAPRGPAARAPGAAAPSSSRGLKIPVGGGGGKPSSMSQILTLVALIAVGIIVVGLLFTVGFFALIVVAVVAAGYFLVRWTKNTSLGRAFANTKIGKDLAVRAEKARENRAAQQASAQGGMQGLPGLLGNMIFPMLSKMAEQSQQFDMKMNKVAQEVLELLQKNSTAMKRLGELQAMQASGGQMKSRESSDGRGGDSDEAYIEAHFTVGGSRSQGEVRVTARLEGLEADDDIEIESAVLLGRHEGEEDIKLKKGGPTIILDMKR